MSYDHSLAINAAIENGVTTAQIADALKPLFELWDFTEQTIVEGRSDTEAELDYDPDSGDLNFYTSGDVSYDYENYVVEAMSRLGPLCRTAGQAVLSDHDTGDLDNARMYIVFGKDEKSREEFARKRDMNAAMELLAMHYEENIIDQVRAILA